MSGDAALAIAQACMALVKVRAELERAVAQMTEARMGLYDERVAFGRVRALVAEWRLSEPRIGTHWVGCHMVHTDCLILAVRAALQDPSGDPPQPTAGAPG